MKTKAAVLVICGFLMAGFVIPVMFSGAVVAQYNTPTMPTVPLASESTTLENTSIDLLLEFKSTGRCHIKVDYSGSNPLYSLMSGALAPATLPSYSESTGGNESTGGTEGTGAIATATSLSFDISTTFQDQTITTAVKMKNIGASNMKAYEEITMSGQTIKEILDFSTNSLWMDYGTGWQDYSSMVGDIQSYGAQFDDWTSQLSGWTSGSYTYTDPTTGMTVTMSNIVVNPDISDSVFQPSTEGTSLSASPVSPGYNSISAGSTQSVSWDISIGLSSSSAGTLTITASGWAVLPLPDEQKQTISLVVAGYNVAPQTFNQEALQYVQGALGSSLGLQVTNINITQLSWDSAASKLTFTATVTATSPTLGEWIQKELPISITTSGSGSIPATTSGASGLSELTLDAVLKIVAQTVTAELQLDISGTNMTGMFDLDFELPTTGDFGMVTETDNILTINFGALQGYLPAQITALGTLGFNANFTLRVPPNAAVVNLPAGYTQAGNDYIWTDSSAVEALLALVTENTQISYWVGPASVTIENIQSYAAGQTIEVENNYVKNVEIINSRAIAVNFERGQAVSRIRVALAPGAQNVRVQAQQLAERPVDVDNIPSERGRVCYYLALETNARAQVENATIEFKVSKLWVRVNDIDTSTVRLLRYYDGAWTELETTKLDEDDNDVYFSAQTSGFSTFAVTGVTIPTAPAMLLSPLLMAAIIVIVLGVIVVVVVWKYTSSGSKRIAKGF